MAVQTPLITLTGTFTDLAGNLLASGTVTAVLNGFGSTDPQVAGGSILATTTISASVSNGTFTLGPIYGNDAIIPGPNVTFYTITMPAPTGTGAAGGSVSLNFRLTGYGTLNLASLVPLTATITTQSGLPTVVLSSAPVIQAPSAQQTINGFPLVLENALLGFSATGSTTADVGVSRPSAGTLALGNGNQNDASAAVQLGTLVATAGTPSTSAGQLGVGTTSGFGTGSANTTVTTTTKGGGTGPTTAATVVKYLEITLAGSTFWVPLMQ